MAHKSVTSSQLNYLNHLRRMLGIEEWDKLNRTIEAAVLSNDGVYLSRLIEVFESQPEVIKQRIDPDPYFPGPEENELGDRGAPIGVEIHKDQPFYWEPGEWRQNCLISGPVGSGKTNSMLNLIRYFNERGISCLVYDRREDYTPLIKTPLDAVVIPWEELRLNPLCPPEGVPVSRWKEKVEDTYAHVWEIMVGGKSLLSKALTSVYKRKEIPTLTDFHNTLAKYETSGSPQTKYKSRIQSRLSMIIDKYGDVVNCAKGFQFERLTTDGKCIIFNLDMEEKAGAWFLLVILWSIYHHRKYSQEAAKKPLVVFLDEARYIIKENPQQSKHFVTDIDELITRSRPLGMCYVIAEQMGSQVSKAIRANTKLKLCFGAEAEELRSAHSMLGLEKKQTKEIPKLALEECIGRFSGERCTVPFKLKTDRFEYHHLLEDRMTHKELIERAKPFIRKLKRDVVPAGKSRKVATVAHKILYNVAKYPALTKSERNIDGVSYSKRNRILERLCRDKLIKKIQFKTGGKPAELYKVTEEGQEELESVGYEIPKTTGRGGVVHSYMVKKIVEFYEKKDCKPHIESPAPENSAHIDVVATSIEGSGYEAVEVHYRNKPSREARKLKRLLNQHYYSKLFIVSDTEEKLSKLRDEMGKASNQTFFSFFTLKSFLNR